MHGLVTWACVRACGGVLVCVCVFLHTQGDAHDFSNMGSSQPRKTLWKKKLLLLLVGTHTKPTLSHTGQDEALPHTCPSLRTLDHTHRQSTSQEQQSNKSKQDPSFCLPERGPSAVCVKPGTQPKAGRGATTATALLRSIWQASVKTTWTPSSRQPLPLPPDPWRSSRQPSTT